MTRGLSADVLRILVAEHELMIGATVLREFERVLTVKFRIPQALLIDVLTFLEAHATVLDAAARLDLDIRDEADGWVLAEAVQAGAELLVTGDRDLLDVAERAPIPIVTPRGLWNSLRGL